MKSTKALTVAAVFAMAMVAPVAHGAYSASFQGTTFTMDVVDPDTLKFTIAGALSASGDWAAATHLGAFDWKLNGMDFTPGNTTTTATDLGDGTLVGGSVYNGAHAQLSASNSLCSAFNNPNAQAQTICYDVSPDAALTDLMVYRLDFSDPVSFGNALPHLQIFFADDNGRKVGSLYSQDLPSTSSSGGSGGASGRIPEPNSNHLALLGVGLIAATMWIRRREQKR